MRVLSVPPLVCLLLALGTGPAAAGPSPLVPAVGDVLTYSISTGEQVTLKTVNVRKVGDRTIATDQETVHKRGSDDRQASLDVIRTDDALAFDIPSAAGETATPLVFFFAQANPQDSWLAQRGSFTGPSGEGITYQVLAQVAAVETVRSPAGTFPGCWKVVFSNTQDRNKRLTIWLKPDLGIVRTQSDYRGETIVTELTGYDLTNFANR